MAKNKPIGAQIKSLRELSRALAHIGLNRSHVALSRIVKDHRWAGRGFASHAPWPRAQVPKMANWIKFELQENRNTENFDGRDELGRALRSARLQMLVARREVVKLDMEILRGEMVLREQHEIATAKQFGEVRRRMMAIPRMLRHSIADTTDPEVVERLLREAFDYALSPSAGWRDI